MAKNTEACEVEIVKKAIEDPEVRKMVDDLVDTQVKYNEAVLAKAKESSIDGNIPNPANFFSEAQVKKLIQKAKSSPTKDQPYVYRDSIENTLAVFKQARAAMMLSNVGTHALNVMATGGNVAKRTLDEGAAIALSKLRRTAEDRREFREMFYFSTGMMRAGFDFTSIAKTVGKDVAKQGAADADDFGRALKSAGYPQELAKSKADLTLDSGRGDVGGTKNIADKGMRYAFNAMFGSQFTALQTADVAFKIMSHRATVHQRLSRAAMKKGMVGTQVDEYVSTEWDKMSKAIKEGGDTAPYADDIAQGVRRAEQDTFTETSTTTLGRYLSGTFETNNWATRGLSETMQILVPFRAIYVNLMRRGLVEGTPLGFLDKRVRDEIMGKHGTEAKEVAAARMATSTIIVGGIAALAENTGMELFGADNINPKIAEAQFQDHGKIGNTLKIGDYYLPVDALPPSVGIPLSYYAAVAQGWDEMSYRYYDPEDGGKLISKVLSPLMSAVADGPWITEYMSAVSEINRFFQSGNTDGLGAFLSDIAIGPVKAPKWIQAIFDDSENAGYMRTTDGALNKFMSEILNNEESYGLRRNRFGNRIAKKDRFGTNSEYTTYMGSDKDYPDYHNEKAAAGLLQGIQFDKVMSNNESYAVAGKADEKFGLHSGADSYRMNYKARDKYDKYVGKSTIMIDRNGNVHDTGLTFAGMVREGIINQRSFDLLYDEKGGPDKKGAPVDVQSMLKLQDGVKQILSQRRRTAKMLVTYNPALKIDGVPIREHQLKRLVTDAKRSQWSQEQIDEMIEAHTQQTLDMRSKLSPYFP